MLSRLDENKGQELLIDAIAELPDEIRNKIIIYFIGFSKKNYLLNLSHSVIQHRSMRCLSIIKLMKTH